MPNLRSKTHAQESYDLVARRKAHQEAEDKEIRKLGEQYIRKHEEDLRQGKNIRLTRKESKHIRQSNARARHFEEQLIPRRANLQRRYHGEAALLYCARTPHGNRVNLPKEICVQIAGINNRPAVWDKALEMPRGMGLEMPAQSPEDNQAATGGP